MNTALLYKPHRRWLVWAAFACAAGIHIGAIVVAQGKSNKIATQDFKPGGLDVEVLNKELEDALPEESVMLPPPEQVPPDQEMFREEIQMLSPVRPRKKSPAATVVHATLRGPAAPFGSVRAFATHAPRPAYPYEARRRQMTGSGIVLLTVDWADGNVVDVRVAQSCGNVILDNAALEAFRRWRFKPGSVSRVKVPITYTLTGISY